jgi:hypothetical protein
MERRSKIRATALLTDNFLEQKENCPFLNLIFVPSLDVVEKTCKVSKQLNEGDND